jgi:phosphoglycolate phosphatase
VNTVGEQRRSHPGPRPKIELATLDVAGTTVQVTDRVPVSMIEAFGSHGYRVSGDEVRAVRGISKREAIANLLGEGVEQANLSAVVESIFSAFRASLISSYRVTPVRPVVGAAEAIEELEARGVTVWLTTGFDREMAELVVGQAGLVPLVAGCVCDDDVEFGRPAPDLIRVAMTRSGTSDPANVLAAGDTVADLEAARAAEVGCAVGVLSGAHDRATLSTAPHDILLESVASLPAALEELDLL